MIFRSFSPEIINRIANIPEVRATLGAHVEGQVLDFTECAERPADYIILTNGHDAVGLFEQKTPVVMDGHSVFDLSCRGSDAIKVGRDMVSWIFENTPALIITGGTPVEFRSARWFNRKVGFKSDGIRQLNGVHWNIAMEHFHILKTEWTDERGVTSQP